MYAPLVTGTVRLALCRAKKPSPPLLPIAPYKLRCTPKIYLTRLILVVMCAAFWSARSVAPVGLLSLCRQWRWLQITVVPSNNDGARAGGLRRLLLWLSFKNLSKIFNPAPFKEEDSLKCLSFQLLSRFFHFTTARLLYLCLCLFDETTETID